jgi:FAD/FMN-containing dehydrogenase
MLQVQALKHPLMQSDSAEDVSKIMRYPTLTRQLLLMRAFIAIVRILRLGSSRTPFAVKGGGHATNPGFSSVRGMQISRSRFNGTNTKVDFTSGIVEVWAGLTWNQVYATLEPTGE